jgi:Domain of unknown function (DUF6468)
MPNSAITLGLEAGLAVLLCAALVFCWRLERKLNALRAGQDGVRAAAIELRDAAAHAEAAVRGLRVTAHEAGRDLQARIDDAKSLADRLGMNARRSEGLRAGGRW